MRPSKWTAEDQATMTQMAADGKAAKDVGLALGVSRNAVLGRAHRTGVRFVMTDEKKAALANRFGKRSGKRSSPKPGSAVYRTRPRGASCYTRRERILAVTSHLAGLSAAGSARLVGASAQTLTRLWMRDDELVLEAREILGRAKALAIESVRERETARHFETVRARSANQPILAKMAPRNRDIVERKLRGESLQQAATFHGITRERARQILNKAVKAGLVAPPGVRLLNDRF